MAELLLLVDSHSLIHQAFHAVGPLTTRDGTPTGAVFGFAQMLLRLLEDERPAALGLAFDTPEPTFRHTAFEPYKAHRDPLDPALIAQFPLVEELATALRWPVVRLPGYEADDILATLATLARDDYQVGIVTADRDLCQLVDERVTVLATQARGVGEIHRFTPAAVLERFGVPPLRLPDWKGLVGDKSDNLPGVRGIGEKTASALLQQYGDLENLLAHVAEIPGKKGETLRAEAATARLCRDLATVCRTAPVPLGPADLRRRDADEGAAAKLLARLELHQLARRLTIRVTTPPSGVHYQTVSSDAQAASVAAAVAAAPVVGLAWREDQPGLAVATSPQHAWLLPLAPPGGRQLGLFAEAVGGPEAARLETVRAALRAGRAVVAADLQPLYREFGAAAAELAQVRGDLRLAAWLLDPERTDREPLRLAARHLAGPPGEPPAGHPDPGAWRACAAADCALRVEPLLREELVAAHLLTIYQELELPLAPLLAAIMAAGVPVDLPAVAALDAELGTAAAAAQAAVRQTAGPDLNVDSPKQLAVLLYETLGLPAGRKTKTGYSTDAATLAELRTLHPVIDHLLEYRELTKLQSTYTQVLLALTDPATSRIHTVLDQTGTATGRLSSARPNLQNIPIRGDWGPRFRNLFRAAPGQLLIAADYSQIELRVLAHVAADATLKEAFRRGEDIHATAAAAIFGVPPEAVSSAQRRMAKVLNFGVAYGIGAHGLAQRLDLSRGEAQALIEAYFERFPNVKRYAVETIARAREQGWVQTIFGRRRPLANLRAGNPAVRQGAERAAINMPIQGAAADLIKRAMLRLAELLPTQAPGVRLLLQVHDELLLEAPAAAAPAAARLVRQAMCQAAELDVPLEVKVAVGERWGALQELPGD
ncbi:MAG: DNA polymerase I [Fimbriimonadaceae bacterium]|nr:DNA polymerase I [Fimbriimonadaceae bacterium]